MGSPDYTLVPAAILLDNKLSKEKFGKKLQEVYSLDRALMPWQFCKGVYALPQILGIPTRDEYRKFYKMNRHVDAHGLVFGQTKLQTSTTIENDNICYKVEKYVQNIVRPQAQIEKEIWDTQISDYQEGRVIHSENDDYYSILNVKNMRKLKMTHEFRLRRYKIVMDVMPFHKVVDRESFDSVDELIKSYPQFDPDFMYDFEKPFGKINLGRYLSNFYWIKEDGKYTLDKAKTFDAIKSRKHKEKNNEGTIISVESGYTDLILTAEGIKKKHPQIFRYRERESIDEFLKRYPSSRKRYGNHLWNCHTSLFAKSVGMTYSELLRYRMLGQIPGDYRNIVRYDDET